MQDLWIEFSQRFPWLVYLLEIGLVVLGAWFVSRFVLSRLQRRADRTGTLVDDTVVQMVRHALKPAAALAILAAASNLLPLPARFQTVLNRVFYVAALALGLYYAAQVAQMLLNAWLARAGAGQSLRDPLRFVTRVVFAVFGVMIVLENLGISLTAVWTTLGVGSIAIALALQDTLSNFFAGVYVRLDRPVRVADYVKLESGEEGYVTQVGWRSTRIRTLANNIVVVPNSKLASAIITNFALPEPQMALLLPVNVSYDTDPDELERILIEEAKSAAGKIDGLLADPAPFVRFIPGFGDSSLGFTLVCRVRNFADQYLVQHELRKRIFARLRRERIEIPLPQREVHVVVPANGSAEESRFLGRHSRSA